MKHKYFGSLGELQNGMLGCNIFGDWSWNENSRCHRFRSQTGEILDWWPSNGTIYVHGKPGPLQRRFTSLFLDRLTCR